MALAKKSGGRQTAHSTAALGVGKEFNSNYLFRTWSGQDREGISCKLIIVKDVNVTAFVKIIEAVYDV